MKSDCILCTFQKQCPEGHTFLYAATPILQSIVASHLIELGAAYRLDQDLFRLEDDAEHVVQELRSRLSDAERADIRVSKERGSAMLAACTLDAYGRTLDTAWFDEAIENDSFTTYFQPIMDVRTSEVFAHECLIRLIGAHNYNGGEIIDAAVSRGARALV